MTDRPKIGLALSGASGRAIAHIGVIEVLQEHGIPIDVIVGCSSGALIAAAFATDRMAVMKDWMYQITLRKLFKLWSSKNARGGLFHIHKADKELNKITKNLRFEDVPVKLGFSATDIETGELITLSSGSINKALKASVAIPGLFEPVVWGKRILVDGGLVNIVPTLPAKQMGADIVIGVNLATAKFIFERKMPIWRGYRSLTRLLGLRFIREKLIPKLTLRMLIKVDTQSDLLEEEDVKVPGMWSIFSKAIEHSFRIDEQWDDSHIACDLMIEPNVKQFGKAQFSVVDLAYHEGRRAGLAAIPKIKRLIKNYRPTASVALQQQPESAL